MIPATTTEMIIRSKIEHLKEMLDSTANKDRSALIRYGLVTLEDLLLEITPLDF